MVVVEPFSVSIPKEFADVASLAEQIIAQSANRPRTLVALAGAPASGKSTLAAALAESINQTNQDSMAVVVPMDGFHYDNSVIEPRGLLSRKGSPETFDVPGLLSMIKRLATLTQGTPEKNVAIPVFDRSLELSRGSARIVDESDRIVMIEGNYLLLEQAPWSALKAYFDCTVMLDVPLETLRQRLIQRWLSFDHTREEAEVRAESNDIPNAKLVLQHSCTADFIYNA